MKAAQSSEMKEPRNDLFNVRIWQMVTEIHKDLSAVSARFT
jgi:hypothetical protein